jgi:hypothetical protein
MFVTTYKGPSEPILERPYLEHNTPLKPSYTNIQDLVRTMVRMRRMKRSTSCSPDALKHVMMIKGPS